MFNSPLEILFSPITIAQGVYVKQTILHLDEPDGVRTGQVGDGETLRLLIAGDSAAAGVGASQQTEALSGRLVAELKPHYQCAWALHAKTGFSTTVLIQYLSTLPAQAFDVAVVSIGVNDVTKPLSIRRWKKQMQKLHQIFLDKFAVRYVIYTELPPMHYFPSLPNPLRYFLGSTAKKMNTQLRSLFSDKVDSSVLMLNFPFDAQFIAEDGFHPSTQAYQLWAKHAAEHIQQHYPRING